MEQQQATGQTLSFSGADGASPAPYIQHDGQTYMPTEAVINEIPMPPLYPLNEPEVIAVVTQRLTDAITLEYQHKLRRPMLEVLIAREAKDLTELEMSEQGEERYRKQTQALDVEFYDQIATAARGYIKPRSEWREMDDALRSLIPAEHKAVAVQQWTQPENYPGHIFELDIDPEEFSFDALIWPVRHIIGPPDNPDYVIRYEIERPTEGERRELRDNAADVSYKRGSGRSGKSTIRQRLRPYVTLYDRRCKTVSGTTPADPRLVDPIWKRRAIETVMQAFGAALGNSKAS